MHSNFHFQLLFFCLLPFSFVRSVFFPSYSFVVFNISHFLLLLVCIIPCYMVFALGSLVETNVAAIKTSCNVAQSQNKPGKNHRRQKNHIPRIIYSQMHSVLVVVVVIYFFVAHLL